MRVVLNSRGPMDFGVLRWDWQGGGAIPLTLHPGDNALDGERLATYERLKADGTLANVLEIGVVVEIQEPPVVAEVETEDALPDKAADRPRRRRKG